MTRNNIILTFGIAAIAFGLYTSLAAKPGVVAVQASGSTAISLPLGSYVVQPQNDWFGSGSDQNYNGYVDANGNLFFYYQQSGPPVGFFPKGGWTAVVNPGRAN